MSTKSPLARVKQEFGGKDKLVDKIVGLVDVGDESKDDYRKRLLGAANGKLIRLFSVATRVKKEGGHDKLVSTTALSLGRGKDKDYVQKLATFPDARLIDILQASEKRNQRKAGAGAAADAAGGEKKAASARAKKPARGKATAEKSA